MSHNPKIANFIKKIQLIQSLMVQVSTYKVKINEKKSEYKKLYRELDRLFEEFNIPNPNPFANLNDFYGYWSMKLKTWESRRQYINALYKGIEEKLRAIEPTVSLEEIALSGLTKLGYNLVENTIMVPSGEPIDFVMERDGKLFGFEIKSRNVAISDIKDAILVQSSLGIDKFVFVSDKGFGEDALNLAKEHGYFLKTLDEIIEEVEDANEPANELKLGIENRLNFLRDMPPPKQAELKAFQELFEKCLTAKSNDEKKKPLENLAEMFSNA